MRRVHRLVAGLLIALPVAGSPMLAERATAATCRPTGVDVLEPASVVAPVVGATTDGETAFLVSRGLSPATVGIYDIDARKVLDNVELPTGDGGWGATLAGGDVYVGTYGETADVHRLDPQTKQVTQVARLEGRHLCVGLGHRARRSGDRREFPIRSGLRLQPRHRLHP